ncbi:hypothetical protein RF11_13880 [Thelohanellus kitauei]|uniref:Uncharacterized protein n=1 Tax=Thelohanellus kitauei TaxID=669202 RepID=A0A0C2JA48_THEKT|nr:hypothetical protein RF11_13880 [Thelohanellus kitauei]
MPHWKIKYSWHTPRRLSWESPNLKNLENILTKNIVNRSADFAWSQIRDSCSSKDSHDDLCEKFNIIRPHIQKGELEQAMAFDVQFPEEDQEEDICEPTDKSI